MKASVSWGFGNLYFYELENNEILSYSIFDRSWGYIESDDVLFLDLKRDKGAIDIDESLLEELRIRRPVRFVPPKGHRYYRESGYPGQEEYQKKLMTEIRGF